MDMGMDMATDMGMDMCIDTGRDMCVDIDMDMGMHADHHNPYLGLNITYVNGDTCPNNIKREAHSYAIHS